jgi:hypothetical protein
MTEQFRFDQLLGNGRHVQAMNGLLGARAVAV